VTGCVEVLNYQPNFTPLGNLKLYFHKSVLIIHQLIFPVNFFVNLGLRQDGTTIWLASNTYTTSPSNMFYNGPPLVTGKKVSGVQILFTNLKGL